MPTSAVLGLISPFILVVMVDERLSSVEAAQNLSAAGVKGTKQKAVLDAVAAQSILQSYFDGLR